MRRTEVAHVLGELSDDDVDWMLANGEQRCLAAGDMLIHEGVPVDALFVILDGVLTVSKAIPGAEELATLGPGQVVGEMSFLDTRPPVASVTALEDALVYALPTPAVTARLALDAGFSARFHRAVAVFLSDRLRSLQTDPLDHGAGEPFRAALGGNVHLAQARLERLLTRLGGDRSTLLTGNDLTIEGVVRVAEKGARAEVSPTARARIARSRSVVEQVAAREEPIYGVNLGLGALKGLEVSPKDNARFQRNILMSHAVGMGPEYETAIVRAIMLARLNGMARGGSGVQPAAFDLLLAMLNAGIHPAVPSRGSVGMSDLSPLAHLALPLIGLSEVEVGGRRMPSGEALGQANLQPLELSGKDALAFCSANSVSVGHGALVVARCIDLLACGDIAAALSLEASGVRVGLAEQLHVARPYSGQLASADRLRALLDGSGMWDGRASGRVYEPLSFRCVPQVHGACQDALSYVRRTLETELNSTGDNPVVLLERESIVPNGNFHPAGLSIAFDMLGIALAQVTSMATNRVTKLMSPELVGLPPQLTPAPGVNCGLGMLQKAIAAMNAEVRFLANPASLDFTPVANSIEDHATMATLSVSKAEQIVDYARCVFAIELLCAAQAIDLRGPASLGKGTQAAYDAVRGCAPFMSQDRLLAPDLERLCALLRTRELLRAVNAVTAHQFGLDLA